MRKKCISRVQLSMDEILRNRTRLLLIMLTFFSSPIDPTEFAQFTNFLKWLARVRVGRHEFIITPKSNLPLML